MNGTTEPGTSKASKNINNSKFVLTPLSIKLNKIPFKKSNNSDINKLLATNYTVGSSKFKTTEPSTPQTSLEFSVELKKVINERNILTSKTRKRVFEALDEIKTKSEEESRAFKRERSLLEIVNSEIKYVHQLETLIQYFMKPTEEKKLLKPNDFQTVFGNINTIYKVNKELLEELDKGHDNVCYAFRRIAPFLKLYSVYALEFKYILQVLQNARSLNPQFAKFVEDQETRPEVQSKLSALLITPIQRVPRYKLLLSQLKDLTKPTEEDHRNLMECLEKIEDAAGHINKIIEDQENMQRLLEVQRYLRSGEPNIIKPGRKLLKEGILVKMSSKNSSSEKLYTVLMNDIILFNRMKKNEPTVNSLKCFSIFPLGKCKVIEILDKGCMKIVCQEEELILYHDQFSETKKWMETLKSAIESHLSDRKTLRKDSSSRRPVKRKDLHEYHEVGLSPGRPMKKRKMEMGSTVQACAYKISRRRPIHSKNVSSSFTENILQAPFPSTTGATETSTEQQNNDIQPAEDMSKDLFVFGRPQHHNSFKFGKFLGDVSISVKRLLGFRN